MVKKADHNSGNPETVRSSTSCEFIAIVSGKGGTGKTFIASSMAYALIRAGQRTCLIDTDLGTQGLSLFILGDTATRGLSRGIDVRNSLYQAVAQNNDGQFNVPVPFVADRGADHGISYDLIISNSQFYDRRLALGGVDKKDAKELLKESMSESNDVFRRNFKSVISTLFTKLSQSGKYDYVLVDTQGGFGELSLLPAVFSDSIIVIAESDPTSFHQMAKLLTNVDLMAQQEQRQPYIRGVIVNKSVDGEDMQYRLALESQFGVEIGQTWPLPLDSDAILSYKSRQVPFLGTAKGSKFSAAATKCFTEIFDIVTADWGAESKRKWRLLVDDVAQERAKVISVTRESEEKVEQELSSARENAERAQHGLRNSQEKLADLESIVKSVKRDFSEVKGKNETLASENKVLQEEIKNSLSERREVDLLTVKRLTTFRLSSIGLSILSVIMIVLSIGLITYGLKLNAEIAQLNAEIAQGEKESQLLFLRLEGRERIENELRREIKRLRMELLKRSELPLK